MRATLDNLIGFTRRRVKVGNLGANSAQSYLTSIERVFEVATEAEKADVLTIDLDALFVRFRKKANLQANTLASYEGRVKAAINTFAGSDVTGGDEPSEHIVDKVGTLTIPLRAGLVSIDGLPADLTEAEARRIASVIIAMAS